MEREELTARGRAEAAVVLRLFLRVPFCMRFAPRCIFMLIAVAVETTCCCLGRNVCTYTESWHLFGGVLSASPSGLKTPVFRTNYSSIPGGDNRFSSSLKRPDRLWGTPSLVFNGCRNCYFRVKAASGGR